MWHKVNELSRKVHLNQVQIAKKLAVSRSTVQRYLSMTEDDFEKMLQRETNHHTCKLDGYREFIVNELTDAPFLSCAQVMDHLKEHFPNMPSVSEKTVYNYVMRVRREANLPKDKEFPRLTNKLDDCEFGEIAQVDFGQRWMQTTNGSKVKVYIFAMILSRSRYKFIYLQSYPFTSVTAVYAHHLAFKFFGGMPRKIWYDQDAVFLVDENYGDYIMTEEFAKYVKEAGFEAVFMMAADPQSKGKIENCIRYVKHNFLPGRIYTNQDALNDEAIGWLSRTANAKVHSTTKLIPAKVFEEERKYLLPYTVDIEDPKKSSRPYVVRNDNTILYRSNLYQLPDNTYKGKGSMVLVVVNYDAMKISFYDAEKSNLIIEHDLCELRGQYINKKDVTSRASASTITAEKQLYKHVEEEGKDILTEFLAALKDNRPRYYRKSVIKMVSILLAQDKACAVALLKIFTEKREYNANAMEAIANAYACNSESTIATPTNSICLKQSAYANIVPEKRPITSYSKIIDK
jgi:transposase